MVFLLWGIDWFEGPFEDWDWVEGGAKLCFQEEESPKGKLAGLVLFLLPILDMATVHPEYNGNKKKENWKCPQKEITRHLPKGMRSNYWWEALLNREITSNCRMLARMCSVLLNSSMDKAGEKL